MILEFVQVFEQQLWTAGFTIDNNPNIPGMRGLLKVVSPKITSVGPIKFVNNYLFLDWDNDLFGRLDTLIAAQKTYSKMVNKNFRVPNAWRVTFPNIVVAAVSTNGFPKEAVDYVQSRYQIPWTGGEIGQMMLFDLQNHKQYCHYPRGYKQTGSIPLGYAVDELFGMFMSYVPEARLLMHGEQ
jgi:hypothetical protein